MDERKGGRRGEIGLEGGGNMGKLIKREEGREGRRDKGVGRKEMK
jgi:hypothetical protein